MGVLSALELLMSLDEHSRQLELRIRFDLWQLAMFVHVCERCNAPAFTFQKVCLESLARLA